MLFFTVISTFSFTKNLDNFLKKGDSTFYCQI